MLCPTRWATCRASRFSSSTTLNLTCGRGPIVRTRRADPTATAPGSILACAVATANGSSSTWWTWISKAAYSRWACCPCSGPCQATKSGRVFTHDPRGTRVPRSRPTFRCPLCIASPTNVTRSPFSPFAFHSATTSVRACSKNWTSSSRRVARWPSNRHRWTRRPSTITVSCSVTRWTSDAWTSSQWRAAIKWSSSARRVSIRTSCFQRGP